jgi:hypothetical protein
MTARASNQSTDNIVKLGGVVLMKTQVSRGTGKGCGGGGGDIVGVSMCQNHKDGLVLKER